MIDGDVDLSGLQTGNNGKNLWYSFVRQFSMVRTRTSMVLDIEQKRFLQI